MRPGAETSNLKAALREFIVANDGESKADAWNTAAPRATPGAAAAGRHDSGTGQGTTPSRRRHLPEETQQAVAQAERLLGLLTRSAPAPDDTPGGRSASAAGGRRADMGGALRRFYDAA